MSGYKTFPFWVASCEVNYQVLEIWMLGYKKKQIDCNRSLAKI